MQKPNLPKPEWLTLQEAVTEICSHGLDKLAVKETIHRLLQEARISSRCRCRAYYEDDNIHSVRMGEIPNIWTNILYKSLDFNKCSAMQNGIGRFSAVSLGVTTISDILVSRTDILPLFSIPLVDSSNKNEDKPIKKSRAGAKRLPMWDYVWAEMARRAIKGEWNEDLRQSHAIRQIGEWIKVNFPDDPSDDAIKDRVSILWNALGWTGDK